MCSSDLAGKVDRPRRVAKGCGLMPQLHGKEKWQEQEEGGDEQAALEEDRKVGLAGVQTDIVDCGIDAGLLGEFAQSSSCIVEPRGKQGGQQKAGNQVQHQLADIAPQHPNHEAMFRWNDRKVNLSFVLGICAGDPMPEAHAAAHLEGE